MSVLQDPQPIENDLKNCKYCNYHPVTQNSASCPKCGGKRPYPKEEGPPWYHDKDYIAIVTLIIIYILLGYFFGDGLSAWIKYLLAAWRGEVPNSD